MRCHDQYKGKNWQDNGNLNVFSKVGKVWFQVVRIWSVGGYIKTWAAWICAQPWSSSS